MAQPILNHQVFHGYVYKGLFNPNSDAYSFQKFRNTDLHLFRHYTFIFVPIIEVIPNEDMRSFPLTLFLQLRTFITTIISYQRGNRLNIYINQSTFDKLQKNLTPGINILNGLSFNIAGTAIAEEVLKEDGTCINSILRPEEKIYLLNTFEPLQL